MTPERWRLITGIFHAARVRDADARAALLDEACAGDRPLREEVDAMLAAHEGGGAFGEEPAFIASASGLRLQPGTALGPYHITALIGSGGMGEVYRAHDTRLGREVAVKILPGEVFADPGRRARLTREARAASALNHPNIITIHDIGEAEGVLYVVMECVQGATLRYLLAQGPVDIRQVLQIATQAAQGLAKAHATGLVHRDLKPENLMVTADGVVKILDFGLVKQAPGAAPLGATPTSTRSHTAPGMVMGTLGYMSPEQATARPVDFRSDQFSLGAILYELATGTPAFQRGSAAETLSAVLRDDPEPLDRLNPGAPARLRSVVERCLRKDPVERYASTRDLARELEAVSDGLRESADSRPDAARPEPSARPIRRRLTAAALVGLVALAGLGAWRALATRPRASAGAVPAAASIAVLPFQNFGGRAEDEYFADGTSDALITELARARGLTVIARNTSFQYKGKTVDVRRMAEEMKVGYVLEGSVQRSGDRLRVRAQLIDAATGAHRWAERYDRQVKDVFAIQDAIAGDVAAALHVALDRPAGGARAAPTSNLEAYDAYLRGRYLLLKDDEDPRGFALIERAAALDPAFAAAHSALALAYAARFWFEQENSWEEKAAIEVEKALRLDPDHSDDAYLARGWLAWNVARGFPHEATARDLRRALAINPNNPDASFLIGLVYLHMGLLEESRTAFARTLRLNPHKLWHPGIRRGATTDQFIAWTFLLEHSYERALAEYDQNPHTTYAAVPVEVAALLYLGREAEARDQIERILAKFAGNPRARDELEPTYSLRALLRARAGDTAGAEQDIAETIRLGQGWNHFHHSEYVIGSAYALMGRKREAVAWLERSVADGFHCYPCFEKDPYLRSLQGDPAFDALLRRLETRWEGYRALPGSGSPLS